jgi:hypothetical protein
MTALRSAYRQTSTTTGDFSFLSLDAVDTVDAGNDGGRGGSTLGRAGAATPAKIGIAQVHLLLRRDSELQQPWMAPWQRPCRWFRQRQTELEDKLCGTSNWAFGLYFLFPDPQPKLQKQPISQQHTYARSQQPAIGTARPGGPALGATLGPAARRLQAARGGGRRLQAAHVGGLRAPCSRQLRATRISGLRVVRGGSSGLRAGRGGGSSWGKGIAPDATGVCLESGSYGVTFYNLAKC